MKSQTEIRTLQVSDSERIERFRRAGYGGSVSDALWSLGIKDTVLSDKFKPLRQGMQIVGRALPVKIHTEVDTTNLPGEQQELQASWQLDGVHPQKAMMQAVGEAEDGTVLCFDCGGDMQAAHFGEMSCQLAQAHGCRGLIIAGNCRDTQYVLQMPDFPVFCFGTRPNAFGGWMIISVNKPIYLPGHLTHYVKIMPGDFIFGDNDGVQVIPKDVVDEVLLRVEETFEKENKERMELASGMELEEVYRTYGIL